MRDNYFQAIIYGYSGSGKSNIIRHILSNFEELNFDLLLVISEECEDDREYGYLPQQLRATTFDINKINMLRDPKYKSMRKLLIFDDVMSIFNDHRLKKVAQAVFSNIRKYNICSIMSIQNLTSIPPMIRLQASLVFIANLDGNSSDLIRSITGRRLTTASFVPFRFLFVSKYGDFYYFKL